MATIKSYTDIEQSKKLAKILSLESADMHYVLIDTDEDKYAAGLEKYIGILPHYPCWSLSALLDVLPDYTLQINTDGTVFVVCDSKKPMISDAYDNLVDACYEMILKLHELKML